MNRADLTTYLLAGGQSRRFGRDKALIELDGQPIVPLILHRLGPELNQNVYISGPPRPAWADLPVRGYVADRETDGGPLVALISCLAQCETEAALFVACDMPRSPLLASLLADRHDLERHTATHFCRSLGPKGGQPVPCIVRADQLGAAETALAGGRRSMHAFLKAIGAQQISAPEQPADPFQNLNRPTDLEPTREGWI